MRTEVPNDLVGAQISGVHDLGAPGTHAHGREKTQEHRKALPFGQIKCHQQSSYFLDLTFSAAAGLASDQVFIAGLLSR